jgi:hypothetical protein
VTAQETLRKISDLIGQGYYHLTTIATTMIFVQQLRIADVPANNSILYEVLNPTSYQTSENAYPSRFFWQGDGEPHLFDTHPQHWYLNLADAHTEGFGEKLSLLVQMYGVRKNLSFEGQWVCADDRTAKVFCNITPVPDSNHEYKLHHDTTVIAPAITRAISKVKGAEMWGKANE